MNYYKHGDWNAVCDVCGWKFKASQLKKRWDGAIVCPADYELRHPQDLIRHVPEKQGVDFVRREPPDTFITVTYVADTVGIQSNFIPEATFTEYLGQGYWVPGYVDYDGYVEVS